MTTISTSEAVNYGLRSTRSSSDKWGNWTEVSQSHHIAFGETIPAGAMVGTATVTVHVSGQPIIGSYFYVNGVSARTTVGDHAVSLDTVAAGASGFDLTITFKGTGTKNTISVLNIDRIDFTVSYTPTQSSLNLSTNTMDAGDSLTATIISAVSTYSHKLTTTFGIRSQVQQLEAGVTTATVTVPVEWLDQIPNAGSGTGTVTLDTLDGTTVIGTTAASLTITVPDSAAPVIEHTEEPEYTVGGTTYPDVSGGHYVQGTSAIKAKATAITGQYGATITRQTITCQGTTTTGSSLTTGLLRVSGSVQVVYTATDSRGLTVTYTETVEVMAYQWPSIRTLTLERVDDDGEPSDTGTKAKGSVTYAWSKLGDKNDSVTVKISYSLDGSSWTDVQTTTETGTAVSFETGTFGTEQNVKFRVQVTDGYASAYTAEKIDALDMGWVARWFRHDRAGVAFGQASTKADAFQIREDWDYYQGENRLIDLAKAEAPVQSVNGLTGAVVLNIPETPVYSSSSSSSSYSFYCAASSSVQFSTFTPEKSGVYLYRMNVRFATTITSRAFFETMGTRVSIPNNTPYPCVDVLAVARVEAGETYGITFYTEDTTGTYTYEGVTVQTVWLCE